jgi:serine/threonine protein kinase
MQSGDLLGGKYTLEARLGAGAMGEVWKARNKDIGRDVAIKILRREHRADREIVSRFLREARAANLVRHANVVDVLDVGEDPSGVPFLVQELLEGEDLGAHLTARANGLPLDVATKLLMPIVEAVAFAHGRGVVHRDIKPENVFLARSGAGVVPKLLDFGISHVAIEGAQRMTATGVALGTPAYMSPEQIKGTRNVDTRSDVWALGVLLHETLSGQLPFKSETVGDLFVQIATTDPIPLEIAAPHAPRAMARIVAKCLKRSPAERYQDAGTLLFDLEAVAAEARPSKAQFRLPAPDGHREAATEPRRAVSPEPALEPLALMPLSAPLPADDRSESPPSRVARFHSIGTTHAPDAGRRLVISIAASLGALASAGIVASLDVWPDEWALGPSIAGVVSGLGPTGGRVAALACAVAAGVTGLQGWRCDPRSFGHFLAAAAGVAVAIVMVSAAGGGTPATPLPWAVAAAAVGAGAIAIRRATDAWLDDLRRNSVACGAAATAAFVVARLLVR